MSFKIVRLMMLMCLLFGRLNALIEPLTSERFVYEEQLLKKVVKMEIWMEQMEREMSQRKTLEQLTLEVENKIAEMSQTHDTVKNTLHNLTLEVENKMAEIKFEEERESLPMIAFNAYELVDYSLDTNQKLVFKNTYLNEGNGYDTVHGVFSAPIAGLYMFSMHACNAGGTGFYYYIVVDNNIIAKSAKYDSAGYDCASVVTLTKLEKDQKVWVKCSSGYSSTITQLIEDAYSQCTFSGVLLHG